MLLQNHHNLTGIYIQLIVSAISDFQMKQLTDIGSKRKDFKDARFGSSIFGDVSDSCE